MRFEFQSLLDVAHEFSVRLPRDFVRSATFCSNSPVEAAQFVVGSQPQLPDLDADRFAL
jgi:hypothetical protein